MIVVDSNIIGYLFLESAHSVQAEDLLRNDPDWAAPWLWRSELRNVLVLYVRKNLLTLEASENIMDVATDLMNGREYDVNSSAVLQLASRSRCSAYDCEFVALSQHLGVALVTVDRQILTAFPAIAISLSSALTY